MAALQLLLSALLVCQVYSAPTIAPTVTSGDKQHTDVETSSKTEDNIKTTEKLFSELENQDYRTESKLPSNIETSVKTTIIVEDPPQNNFEQTSDLIKDSTTTSKIVNTESITEKLRPNLDTESLKSVHREETEINEKSKKNTFISKEYPLTSTTTENPISDPNIRDITEEEQREEDTGYIPPDPSVSDFLPDEIVGGPLPESEIVTSEVLGSHVYPEYIPETLSDEPIEPQVEETSLEEMDDMDPNPPSIIPDEALLDINDDPLPVADDIIEEVPENPPEKLGEEEDSGPINII